MAFDVYVGTMTRFYRQEWENAAQRMCREQGIEYRMIHIGGDAEPPPSAAEIREAIGQWWRNMTNALSAQRCGTFQWNEGDNQPYFTARPAWDGYHALLVWTAHAEHRWLPLPPNIPDPWSQDAAFQRSTRPGSYSRFRTILSPQMWLPVDFPFTFEGPTLASSNPTHIGSVFTLKRELDEVHRRTSQRLNALKNSPEGESEKRGLFARLFCRPAPPLDPSKPKLAEAADRGLQIFRDLAAKACEHRLPLLLSF